MVDYFNSGLLIMNKRSLENRLLLFAASRNYPRETCRVMPSRFTNSIFLQVLDSSLSSDYISDVSLNIDSDFSIFYETFEPNTIDFCFIYEDD